MPAAVRDGDATTGTCDKGLPCCPHGRSGTVSVTSGNVFVNGRGLHRLNDMPNELPAWRDVRECRGKRKRILQRAACDPHRGYNDV